MAGLLELKSLHKEFGGLVACANLNLEIKQGEIFSLIGPTGAGKATVFNMVSGLYAPTSGEIRLAGTLLNARLPHSIAALGISRTFQNIRLFSKMTVLDNVLVGGHLRFNAPYWASLLRTPHERKQEKEAVARARETLAFVGLRPSQGTLAQTLPYGLQRRRGIARPRGSQPKLLLLDEPAAGTNPQ